MSFTFIDNILMFAGKIYEVDDRFTAIQYRQMANEVLRMLQWNVCYLTGET